MMIAALFICLAPTAYDGDTIRCGNTQTRIRLFAISAPELSDPGGPESKAALAPLLAGGVECEIKGASYSRLVAVCENSSGQDVGHVQMQTGHATEWCSYSVSKAYPTGFYGTCR